MIFFVFFYQFSVVVFWYVESQYEFRYLDDYCLIYFLDQLYGLECVKFVCSFYMFEFCDCVVFGEFVVEIFK